MAKYTYKDIIDALTFAGFEEEKNNGGSHQKYVNAKTGICVPVPKHSNGEVAPGTAEAILDVAVLCARICEINIGSYHSNLSKAVVEYVRKQHQKINEDFSQIVPPLVRKQNGLETKEQVAQYVKQKIKEAKAKKQAPKYSVNKFKTQKVKNSSCNNKNSTQK